MLVDDTTLRAIEGLYEAALHDALWPAALREIAALTKSQAASVWVLDNSGNSILPTFVSINFDPTSVRDYLKEMASIDPTNRYLIQHPDEPIVHDGLLPDDRSEKTRAYVDWHERNVETRFRMVGQAQLGRTALAGIALHRTRKTGRYEPADIERFAVLHGHLKRALTIGLQLGTLGTIQKFGAEWLDRSNVAIVLLDAGKQVIFANSRAQELQSANDGLRFGRDGIFLASRTDNERLRTLIARAVSNVEIPDGTVRASRPSGKPPYGITVFAISQNHSVLSTFRPAACVVITDPDRNPILPAERLQAAFGLTRAQARLAVALASGDDLRIAAEKLAITYGTARTRLAQIFEKTGTKRQGQLIALMLATVTHCSGPPCL